MKDNNGLLKSVKGEAYFLMVGLGSVLVWALYKSKWTSEGMESFPQKFVLETIRLQEELGVSVTEFIYAGVVAVVFVRFIFWLRDKSL